MEYLITNEKQLLKCIIDNPDFLDSVLKEYFISETGANIYQTLSNLKSNDVNFTIEHIVSEGNKIDSNINTERINNLFEVNYDKESFDYYNERLKKDYYKFKISKKLLPSAISIIESKGEFNTEELENVINDVTFSLENIKTKKESLLISSKKMIDIYSENFEKRKEGKDFFTTGDSHLDNYLLQGFKPQYITTIFGATGVGKSTYALNLINKQLNRKIPNIYISLEMDLISTMDRLIAMRNRLPIELLYPDSEKYIMENVYDIIGYEKQRLSKIKDFYFVEESYLSLADVDYIIKSYKKITGNDYAIVTIDLMTMITDFNLEYGSKAAVYEDAMNKLHIMARKHNVHFVCVVQANRNADKMKIDKVADLYKLKPSLNDIKNSHAIGERSRIILSTFRPKYYANRYLNHIPEVEIMKDIAEIDILKQNMGVTSTLYYLYAGETANYFKYIMTEEEKQMQNDIMNSEDFDENLLENI